MPDQPFIILGAGINGAAIARELALEGATVHVVERADIAFGATAYSSRLIHGGLRYLEHGEFDLVRESLAERRRLLKLAPQFVRPLRLVIPVSSRASGFAGAIASFLGIERKANRRTDANKTISRGLWLVRLGLWLYRRYARDPDLAETGVTRVGAAGAMPVDPARYRWLCSYYDAQVRYPERFTLALLDDARRAAGETGGAVHVHTYSRLLRDDDGWRIVSDDVETPPIVTPSPAAIINATGAWVDTTLQDLGISERRLIGGTKGSHFLTSHEGLRRALGGDGVYAEAADGRPVFILPFGDMTLVGTTDIPFEGDPAEAVASKEELDYLLCLVNSVFPSLHLTSADIDLHYSGVRPLPYVNKATPAAITRRHWLEEHTNVPTPTYSVIGGKLTTCRSLADDAVTQIFARLDRSRASNSRDRVLPGGEGYPHSPNDAESRIAKIAEESGWSLEQARAVWSLCGTLAEERSRAGGREENLPGTSLPISFVRWVIANEWARSVDDLIERRLMLLYHPRLRRACLQRLAELLVESGRLKQSQVDDEVRRTIERLATHFGKQVYD